MDIYQCMTCGERWPHEGLERNMDIAVVHQGKGHEVRVGNIDNLAKERKKFKKTKTLVRPNDNYEVVPQPLPMTEEQPTVFGLS